MLTNESEMHRYVARDVACRAGLRAPWMARPPLRIGFHEARGSFPPETGPLTNVPLSRNPTQTRQRRLLSQLLLCDVTVPSHIKLSLLRQYRLMVPGDST